jgi:hypothetical protein
VTFYLMAFLLIGSDGWRIGDSLDGDLFHPTPFTSLQACLEQRLDRQISVVKPNGVTQIHWACVPDMEEK